MVVHALVERLQVAPQLVDQLVRLRLVGHMAEQRGNGHHHREVVEHVGAQRLALHLVIEVNGLEHDPGDAQLLAVARNHDLLVDTLVLATDEVAVEVHVAIEELLAARQRHIGEDVVHIEGVARQRHATVAQHLRAVEQRVHEQVLVDAELAHLVPGEDATLGKHAAVAHGLLCVVFHVLVDVVRDEQVDDLAFGN